VEVTEAYCFQGELELGLLIHEWVALADTDYNKLSQCACGTSNTIKLDSKSTKMVLVATLPVSYCASSQNKRLGRSSALAEMSLAEM